MKYIDRFATLDDFLSSELQQLTGDRIATIDGFTLPILKKKLKTVTTIDPSTNEEVETEELQDVWMVPVGETEKKVEHDFSFITNDAKTIFTSSFTFTKNLYNFDVDATTDANNNLVRRFKNIGNIPEFALRDNGIKTWGWTVTTDNSKFSTTVSQSGYSIVPTTNGVHSYNTSWNNGYYYLRRMYTGDSNYQPNAIKNELINKKTSESLTQDTFEIHDNACTIQYGASSIPVSLNWIYNLYYSQYPQGFDINDIKLNPKLSIGSTSNENIIDSYTYDSSTRILTVHIPNYSGSENLYADITFSGIGDYSWNYVVTNPFKYTPTDSGSEYTWASPYFRNTTSLQDTTLEYEMTAATHWQMQNYWILSKDNNEILVTRDTFSNIHLKIVVGNGGASAATGLTFSASPQTASAEDISLGNTILQGNALYNGVAVDWQQDLSINWTSGIAFLYRESGSTGSWSFDPSPTGNVSAQGTSYKATWSGLTSGREYKMIIPFQYYDNGLQDGDFVILIDNA